MLSESAPAPDPAAAPVAVPPPSSWNIANALTVTRILLVPVYGWLLLFDGGARPGMRWAAAAVFAVATLTDRVDGDLARRRGLITNFGKIADPIADKTLMGMAFVGLSVLGELPWWVTVVVLVREWGVTVLRFFVIRHGVMPAGRGGKVKTTLQFFGLLLFTLPLGSFSGADTWTTVADVIVGLAVTVTVVTGLDIAVKALRLRQTSERSAMKRARRAARQRMSTAPDVVAALVAAGRTVGTAESLTGGLVCAALTDVPGASAVVRGAVVAYATELKARVLGVDPDLLAAGGAVQAEVARQMATGVCRVLGADVGVATTGVAGPEPQDGRPVGTVFVAVAVDGRVLVRELALTGDRATIRRRTVEAALVLVADAIGARGMNGAEDSRPADG